MGEGGFFPLTLYLGMPLPTPEIKSCNIACNSEVE